MCERTFYGCPNCSEPADSEMRSCELRTERIAYHLDSDGEVNHDEEPDYGEGDIECEDDGYKCLACGWIGSSLDDECSSEHCECEECEEPDPSDPGADPDRMVVLRRTVDKKLDLSKIFGDDVPDEFAQLWANRATIFQPLPRWRAAELHDQYLTDSLGAERALPIVIDFNFELPDEAAYGLILAGFDPLKANYKGAPDGGHVAACV